MNNIESFQKKMKSALTVMQQEFSTVRTGRVSPALFAHIPVSYYGSNTPLEKIASISVPEARLVVIQPWDKNALGDIEKAIQGSGLSLNPSNDGNVIRIQVPPLSKERREELVKLVKSTAEKARVSVRNIRREANDMLKKSQKQGEISEDEERREHEKVQEYTETHIKEIDLLLTKKEHEILEN